MGIKNHTYLPLVRVQTSTNYQEMILELSSKVEYAHIPWPTNLISHEGEYLAAADRLKVLSRISMQKLMKHKDSQTQLEGAMIWFIDFA